MAYPLLPKDLQDQVDRVAFAYEPTIKAGKYVGAFEAYEHLYTLLLEKQPSGSRYHKGYPLHNMGFVLYRQREPVKAFHYFILAYIEDLLSEEKGYEDKADNTPAGRTLRQAYLVSDNYIATLKGIIRKKKEIGEVVQDPARVLHEFATIEQKAVFLGYPPDTSALEMKMAKEIPEAPPEEKLQPGMYKQPWERRVFIGGSYKEIAVINEIRKQVTNRDYEAVIASDFDIPQEFTHHHSLMLLHECKRAIFDISQEAGQLMELERVGDYEVETLAVYQATGGEPRVTEMLKALLHSMRIPVKSYKDFDELREHINTFLPDLA